MYSSRRKNHRTCLVLQIRPCWRQHYRTTDAIIYVVDANGRDRIEEARDELHKMMADDENIGKPLLIMANKVRL